MVMVHPYRTLLYELLIDPFAKLWDRLFRAVAGALHSTCARDRAWGRGSTAKGAYARTSRTSE